MSVQIKIKESSNNETEVNKGVLVVEVESLTDADPSTASENDIDTNGHYTDRYLKINSGNYQKFIFILIWYRSYIIIKIVL